MLFPINLTFPGSDSNAPVETVMDNLSMLPRSEDIVDSRKWKLGKYLSHWENRREEIRKQLRRNGESLRMIPTVDDAVLIYRPPKSKLHVAWSKPARVLDQSESQCQVIFNDGVVSSEHLSNVLILPSQECAESPE